ncbi:glycosyltransferase family 2 protein [Algoriphagus confluentis]|uniref:Glycosyltransferase family 2 protein n=1 Tax=Algoriphagus confluentis TaxID=1697556 RepID=A0ABQ6PNJ8_9BACT|nr:glycosyltransferase family 2 protein [Algoriphagus confluentis]
MVERLEKVCQSLKSNFEVILVDDGCPEGSWDTLAALAGKFPEIKGIKLTRNFGQHYAITAGLDHAQGEWVMVMDGDLQDRPEEIPNLYREAIKGFDVVLARRVNRKDSLLKVGLGKLFFRLLSYLTGNTFDPSVGNFGIYHRKVIDAFLKMKEPVRVFSVMVSWMGFSTSFVEVKHMPRTDGKSGYSFRRRLNLALDIILAYSDKPIRLMVKVGLWIAFLSFLFSCITLFRYLSGAITVSGYTSLILSISFFSGILMMMLGIVGLYVGKIFEGVKGRPLYLIDKTIENQEKDK